MIFSQPIKMTASRALAFRVADLLAFDAGTFAGADLIYRLCKAPFTPNPNLQIGDVTEADFTGYGSNGETNGAFPGIDPLTGEPIIVLSPTFPIPGMIAGPTLTVPNMIYGWYVTPDDPGTSILCSALFPQPMLVNADNMIVMIPTEILRWVSTI
jgi:hypothetical protein